MREMSDDALCHACEIDMDDEESMCCRPQTANELFEMVNRLPVEEP